jgi:hypothetical protein
MRVPDIIERDGIPDTATLLRSQAKYYDCAPLMLEAADEIERLRAQNRELATALNAKWQSTLNEMGIEDDTADRHSDHVGT